MPDRRSFLTKIVVGFGAIAGIGFSIPFLRSLFPARDVERFRDIDISSLRPGHIKRVNWMGRPIIILARTEGQLSQLEQDPVDGFIDPDSISSMQPEYTKNSTRSRRNSHFLAFANCTHLGCEVMRDNKGGFSCPCHQSEFDSAGRIRKGGAAKRNLEIPDYRFAGPDTIRLINKRT